VAAHGQDEPASLHRSHTTSGLQTDAAKVELIGQGPLWKMVRAATTDPDGELWRYSIIVGMDHYHGEQIRSVLDR
jgi:hypothetical protein